MVGNEVAAVATGGPMKFMNPLTNTSLLNKDAHIPPGDTGGHQGSGGPGGDSHVKVEVEGLFSFIPKYSLYKL